jgi:hypothetical protein
MSGIPTIPKIAIPAPVRSWMMRKAVWDYLRTRLTYDQANMVKADAEAAVSAVLEDAILRGTGA